MSETVIEHSSRSSINNSPLRQASLSPSSSITASPTNSPRVKKTLVVSEEGDAANLNKVVEIIYDQMLLLLSGSTFIPDKLFEYVVKIIELTDKNTDLTGPEKKAIAVRVAYMLIDKFIIGVERDVLKLLVGSAIEIAVSLSKGNHDINTRPPLVQSPSTQNKRVNCCIVM